MQIIFFNRTSKKAVIDLLKIPPVSYPLCLQQSAIANSLQSFGKIQVLISVYWQHWIFSQDFPNLIGDVMNLYPVIQSSKGLLLYRRWRASLDKYLQLDWTNSKAYSTGCTICWLPFEFVSHSQIEFDDTQKQHSKQELSHCSLSHQVLVAVIMQFRRMTSLMLLEQTGLYHSAVEFSIVIGQKDLWR